MKYGKGNQPTEGPPVALNEFPSRQQGGRCKKEHRKRLAGPHIHAETAHSSDVEQLGKRQPVLIEGLRQPRPREVDEPGKVQPLIGERRRAPEADAVGENYQRECRRKVQRHETLTLQRAATIPDAGHEATEAVASLITGDAISSLTSPANSILWRIEFK